MIIIITIVTLGGIMIKIHTHDTIIHATDRQEFLQAFATIALDMHLYHELLSLLPDAAAFPGI